MKNKSLLSHLEKPILNMLLVEKAKLMLNGKIAVISGGRSFGKTSFMKALQQHKELLEMYGQDIAGRNKNF